MKTSLVKLAMLSLPVLLAGGCRQMEGRAALQRPADRKMAPAFRLLNASGDAVTPADYRGKVIVLNFWATECGGCRAEIPYFVEFERNHKQEGLAVLGVSLDIMYENLRNADEGWGRVKPFVEAHKVNYQILMGDDPVTTAYNVNAMPATYLIDKRGRMAVSYIGVVINRNEVESGIRALLRE